MRSARLLVASILLVFALGTASAGATTFCVKKPTCIGTDKATIKEALDSAALNNNGTDTVYIGANGGTPYDEPISYVDSETVHIIGDGRGQTIVQNSATSVTATVLNPSSTIESMTLRVPDVSNGMGLRWDGTAKDIQVLHEGSASTIGMRAEGNALLEGSTVSIQGLGMFETLNAGTVTIRSSTLFGAKSGIKTGGGGLTIERSTIWSNGTTVFAGGGASVNVYNSVLRLTDTTATTAAAISAPSGASVQLRHATLVGSGQGRGIAVGADTASAGVTAFDSIVDGFQLAVLCLGTAPHTASISTSYSDLTDGANIGDPECSSLFGAGTVDTDPQFVDPDSFLPLYRLKATSPLIDAGDPSDPLAVDFAADPRKIDGNGDGTVRSDIGAYEYQRQAPVAKLSSSAAAAGIGVALDFSSKGSSDADPGDTLTYSWDFGDGTTASGATAQHAYATAGTKTVTLTATDPTGLKATATATVLVSAPPEPPPGGGGPGGGPTLSKVRAVPKRIVIGKANPKLLAGSKAGIRFTLDLAAKVTLKLNRCKGRSGCTSLAKVAGSASFAAAPGPRTIAFAGRFKGRKPLAPGRYVARLYVEGGPVYSTRLDLLAPR